MTAEIAILNKSAVALAADSTVTIGSENEKKTYNTVNKLFTLSKFHPVGVMIYGDAEFMDVPWETLIKQYRKKLGDRAFDYVRDYALDFLEWLEAQKGLFTPAQEEKHFGLTAWVIIRSIKNDVNDDVRDRAPLSAAEIKETARKQIAEWKQYAEGIDLLSCTDPDFVAVLGREYGAKLTELLDSELGGFSLDEHDLEDLRMLICRCVASGAGAKTGVVVAGFGDAEMFPAVRTFEFYRSVAGKILYNEDAEDSHCVTVDSGARVLPFAQKEVVMAFLTGCEESYTQMIDSMFNEFARTFPAVTADRIGKIVHQMGDDQRAELLAAISQDIERIKQDFSSSFRQYRFRKHIEPLLSVIEALPKDELASMAGALVNLTSVKRKMSMEVETVGGPIDVAVVSKGDGFVWISRKHYFREDINPHFMETYFKR